MPLGGSVQGLEEKILNGYEAEGCKIPCQLSRREDLRLSSGGAGETFRNLKNYSSHYNSDHGSYERVNNGTCEEISLKRKTWDPDLRKGGIRPQNSACRVNFREHWRSITSKKEKVLLRDGCLRHDLSEKKEKVVRHAAQVAPTPQGNCQGGGENRLFRGKRLSKKKKNRRYGQEEFVIRFARSYLPTTFGVGRPLRRIAFLREDSPEGERGCRRTYFHYPSYSKRGDFAT